jgi:prepilin-type processing-associated H-X9-DG protein
MMPGSIMRRIARRGIAGFAAAILVAALAVAVAEAAGLPLTKRVLTAGQLAGMRPVGSPTEVTSASAYAAAEGLNPAQLPAEVKRLNKLGFVAGVSEQLASLSNRNLGGLSVVIQFSSAASAKKNVAEEAASNGPWKYFTVAGIPGARGFDQSSSSHGGRNVAFADGSFYYLIGAGWSGGAPSAVSRSALSSVALALYHRVHGKSAP